MSEGSGLTKAAQRIAATAAKMATDPRTHQAIQQGAQTYQTVRAAGQPPLPQGYPQQPHQQQTLPQQQQQLLPQQQYVVSQQQEPQSPPQYAQPPQQGPSVGALIAHEMGGASIDEAGKAGAQWAEKAFWKSSYGKAFLAGWVVSGLLWLLAAGLSIWGLVENPSGGWSIAAYVFLGIMTLVLIALAIATAAGKKRIQQRTEMVTGLAKTGLGAVTSLFGRQMR